MAANPIIPKFPLDWTGKNPTNLVLKEPHTLGSTTQRAFVPNNGPFYTDSLVVYRADTGEKIDKISQYLILQPDQEASTRIGLGVSSVIYVKDTTVGDQVLIDYQVVGGEFSWYGRAIRELLETVNLDERPVKWGDIIGKPNAYPPTPHLHDLGDTYGWEYIGVQLEAISRAILMGDVGSHEELRQQLTYLIDQVKSQIIEVDERLTRHEDDTDNPHQVDKSQVGLSAVNNYGTATKQQAEEGLRDDLYMTPLRTKEAILMQAGNLIKQHVDDKNNPHGVTKDQVGLGNVLNYAMATQQQAEQGTEVAAYMNPLRTKQAIDFLVKPMIQQHIDDKNNPHAVTKEQVGLGSVLNYAISTQQQAEQGTQNDLYMTPLRTKQSILVNAQPLVDAHANLRNNPHGVTKGQVGLDQIPNAVTRQRTLGSDTTLLLAGAMADHVSSGDHDGRYVQKNTNVSLSLREVSGTLQAFVNGAWQTIWPPQWQ